VNRSPDSRFQYDIAAVKPSCDSLKLLGQRVADAITKFTNCEVFVIASGAVKLRSCKTRQLVDEDHLTVRTITEI
jgi:hypothetical protein